ncbi:hypothetical protein M5689_001788 [Euphorbia peplus]|nr:hypothetical protein M5689_001788 [Euphorbia peplus]
MQQTYLIYQSREKLEQTREIESNTQESTYGYNLSYITLTMKSRNEKQDKGETDWAKSLYLSIFRNGNSPNLIKYTAHINLALLNSFSEELVVWPTKFMQLYNLLIGNASQTARPAAIRL